jgi:hypothetical protein
MSELGAEALRDAGLAFLGRIVAIQSHEVTNAFSVINEIAGLQWDILQDTAKGEPVDLLELETTCEKIRAHVRRGQDTIKSINWIAHSVDEVTATIDINLALKKTTQVAEHWMRRRRAHFVLELPSSSEQVETRPFFFAYAVLLGMDLVAPESVGEQTITVACTKADGGVALAIEGSVEPTSTSTAKQGNKIATLTSLVKAIGGELRQPKTSTSTGKRIAFLIPTETDQRGREDKNTKETMK